MRAGFLLYEPELFERINRELRAPSTKGHAMANLRLRKGVLGYVRDTYLGTSATYDPHFRLIDCAIGSSQYGVSEQAIAAHARHSVQANAIYPELFYDRLLKPAIMERFRGTSIPAENLFLGHGSFNLAERLIHKLIEPGTMLGVGPQFNEIPSEFVAAGGRYLPILVREPEYALPSDELLKNMGSGISVLYLDNPNNPLGSHVSLAQIAELARAAERYGVIVMVDEAYGDFVADSESAAYLVKNFRNLAVIRSFSKGLGLAAARVGYMFLSAPLAEAYRQLDVPFEPSLASAELAHATLSDASFITMVREKATAAKKLLAVEISIAGLSVLPTHPVTSIMTVHRAHIDVVALFASIGVSVEPGSAFRLTNPAWDDSYCRLRLPPESDVNELIARLRSLRT
jgi:histidinol-phosphate aminotransferase